jgi:hypothetical protein
MDLSRRDLATDRQVILGCASVASAEANDLPPSWNAGFAQQDREPGSHDNRREQVQLRTAR